MRRVVGGAELARKQAGQGLHLVAPGEQGELFGVGGADLLQPLLQHREGGFPLDLDKLAVAAFAAGLAQQRLGETGRRVLLHDARRTLGADHALVQRVLGIALDVAHLAVAQVHPDAAAAGAHVTGGVACLGGGAHQWGAAGIVKRCGGHAWVSFR
ncbi:hypothetical protein D9M69_522640 [compost metagenome]